METCASYSQPRGKKAKVRFGKRKHRKRRTSSLRERKAETGPSVETVNEEKQPWDSMGETETGARTEASDGNAADSTHHQTVPETTGLISRAKRSRGSASSTIGATDRKTQSTSHNKSSSLFSKDDSASCNVEGESESFSSSDHKCETSGQVVGIADKPFETEGNFKEVVKVVQNAGDVNPSFLVAGNELRASKSESVSLMSGEEEKVTPEEKKSCLISDDIGQGPMPLKGEQLGFDGVDNEVRKGAKGELKRGRKEAEIAPKTEVESKVRNGGKAPLISPGPLSLPHPEPKKLKQVEERKLKLAPMLLMNNLPYMGELTFDTRPRRGRKPKKADICHLISKNYGIHFPSSTPVRPAQSPVPVPTKGVPSGSKKQRKKAEANLPSANVSLCPQSVWGQSPSSLQRNLLGPSFNKGLILPGQNATQSSPLAGHDRGGRGKGKMVELSTTSAGNEEPLNLCVRDDQSHQPSLSIKNRPEMLNLKLPLVSSSLFNDFHLQQLANRISQNQKKINKVELGAKKVKLNQNGSPLSELSAALGNISDASLVNQLSVQFNVAKNAHGIKQGSVPSFSSSSKFANKKGGKSRPSGNNNNRLATNQESDPSGNNPVVNESSSSGAQVSICKFKFTGGAKPSLQEKKILSMDSGGNFRFYTDKDKTGGGNALRTVKSGGSGMDDIESHQGCQYAYASLPKSAKSMSVCMPVGNPSEAKAPSPRNLSTVLPKPSPTGEGKAQSSKSLLSPLTRNQEPTSPGLQGEAQPELKEDGYSSSQSSESGPSSSAPSLRNLTPEQFGGENSELQRARKMRLQRKRRTRKSLMREKLEKTFKEKGFLIQTQQLQSAEGATYCKFRQLRKFTRYLFRSWKDYLPDNVREINTAAGEVHPEGLVGSFNEWSASNAPGFSGRGGGGGEMLRMPESDMDLSRGSRDESEEEEEEEEDEEDEGEEMGMELVPEVTLITQPSSPASKTGSELSGDEEDVDVEHVDDKEEENVSAHEST